MSCCLVQYYNLYILVWYLKHRRSSIKTEEGENKGKEGIKKGREIRKQGGRKGIFCGKRAYFWLNQSNLYHYRT